MTDAPDTKIRSFTDGMLRRWEVSEDEPKRILGKHRKWVESDGKDGERADLSGKDLSRNNLEGASLREANFENANLSEADLRKAGLCGADLRGAHLYKANLREAVAGWRWTQLWCNVAQGSRHPGDAGRKQLQPTREQ